MPDTPAGGPYVFVSYASVDRARVLPVAEAVRGAGVGIWLDQSDITGGASYGPEIAAGIKGCGAVLLMCSAASLASRNVKQEIQLAWRYGKPLLPLLLEPIDFPDDIAYWLEGAQWVETMDRPPAVWLPAVARALARIDGFRPVSPAGTGAARAAAAGPMVDVPGNLPPATGELIGRERELAELRALLANMRLVTLTGPGGSGKTALGLETARRLAPGFTDGAWFVDLSAASDPALVPAAVAGVLGVREEPGQALEVAIEAYLAEKTVLLTLDNLEQVVGAAPFVAAWVTRCPGLTVLATSRVPLKVSPEWAFPVPPLQPPQAGDLPPLPTLAANPAVRLFALRAREARPDFALAEGNAAAVAEICRRLDGLPLAIELAAARVRLLPPPALLDRLGSRLSLLTRGRAGAAPRQQTLRATIAWSHDLLGPDEQAVFRRLAVFAGGCSVAAAEAVAGAGGAPASVLDAIDDLLDHSLLRADGAAGDDEAPRVRMLETIREFALERLDASGEAAAVREAHAAHFLALTEAAEPDLTGARDAETMARLEEDHDNLRAALDWLGGGGGADSGRALRLAGALWRFWLVRGHLGEGRTRLEAVLTRAGSDPARAKAADGAGVLAATQGDADRARALHEDALALHRAAGDRRGAAMALANLGVVADMRGDYAAAEAYHGEALALRRETRDEPGIGLSLYNLGLVALYRADYELANARFADALALFRTLGDLRNVAATLEAAAGNAFLRGDYGHAAVQFAEVLTLRRSFGERQGIAYAAVNLGRAQQLQGNLDDAAVLFAEALPLFHELGQKAGEALTLFGQGLVAEAHGDLDRARRLLLDGAKLNRQAERRWELAETFESIASVVATQGDAAQAARILGAAEAMRSEIGAPLPPAQRDGHDRTVLLVKRLLGDAAYDEHIVRGRAATPDEVIAAAEID